jgi:hypothetical protein
MTSRLYMLSALGSSTSLGILGAFEVANEALQSSPVLLVIYYFY